MSHAGRPGRAASAEEALFRIIGEIYNAVGRADRWDVPLESIRNLFAATAAHLLHHDLRSHAGGVNASTGVDPAALQTYADYYHRVDPWANNLKPDAVEVGDVVFGQSLIPYREMVKTEYYAALGKPCGLSRNMMGYIEAPSSARVAVVSVNRPDRALEFGSEDARLMGILVPHLQRAFALHRQLANLDAERRATADAIDRLPIGVVLIDRHLNVASVNAAADQLLRQRDGLTVESGILRAANPALTTRLNQMVSSAVAVTLGEALQVDHAALALARPSGGRAFQLLVVPVSQRSEDAWAPGAAAIVFVNDPENQPRPDTDLLGQYFGLTPAEARFAAALAGGKPPQEISEAQGLSRATARWLTEQLRTKTGSHTQAQAVAAVLQSLAVLRRDRD
jgi:DNA-binding CsgD family transcriptional regulator